MKFRFLVIVNNVHSFEQPSPQFWSSLPHIFATELSDFVIVNSWNLGAKVEMMVFG